jgi:UDPglucose--hexose-1-phosphate uridylyltransferase
MTSRIHFESHVEKAGFFSPLAGMEFAEQTIEVRKDPLTGMTAVASSELATKEEMFFGKTDWAHADELATTSRASCFFCPERVFDVTPKYPDELVPGGRIQSGRALVFPNLFPLAGVHAVVCYPEKHFLRPGEFTPDLLAEGLGAALDFVGRAERYYPHMVHIEVCCNHMLPAGASMVHPHFQVFGGESVPWQVELYWQRSAEWQKANGVSYWRALVEREVELGERYVTGSGGAHWLVPFAPTGGREVIAVVPDVDRLSELGDDHVRGFAAGMSRVLAWYEEEGLSAFNFTLFGGPLRGREPGFPVVLRIIARSAFKPDFRTDDYFLQKQLGGELMFSSPEQMAAQLRSRFAV